MRSCLDREQETICSIFCDACLFLSIDTWGQCWVATESSDPVPLLHGPQHGALLLCQQCSALHLSPCTQSGLRKSITKCQGEASPLGAITEGCLGDSVLLCVCVSEFLKLLESKVKQMNGWLRWHWASRLSHGKDPSWVIKYTQPAQQAPDQAGGTTAREASRIRCHKTKCWGLFLCLPDGMLC